MSGTSLSPDATKDVRRFCQKVYLCFGRGGLLSDSKQFEQKCGTQLYFSLIVFQCEFHPRCPQRELLNYCRENEIMLQAISFENSFHPLLLNDGTIRIIGRKINRTPTQVILRYAVT